MALTLNALLAFCVAFYFQAKVILTLLRDSATGIGIGDDKSFAANFARFLAGDLYPDLRSSWGKAVLWVILSFAAIFLLAGLGAGLADDP